ncbi:hypothetical protein [Actinoplanes sp. NPDC049802]|uniref:hypothetical protein n=1 Tax=Actinoplanes sp. NPDC049802 TaxID=3154742 RepID=UPI00340FF1A6
MTVENGAITIGRAKTWPSLPDGNNRSPRLLIIDNCVIGSSVGSGKTAILTQAILAALRDADSIAVTTARELRIGDSRFGLSTDPTGGYQLHTAAGSQVGPAPCHLVTRLPGPASNSVLHRITPVEQRAASADANDRPVPTEPEKAEPRYGRLIQRAAVRLQRQIRRAGQSMTVAWLRRRVLRAAIRILLQILRLQRRQHTDVPETARHSHTVDQHRTRGPSGHRTTSSFMVIREPVAA